MVLFSMPYTLLAHAGTTCSIYLTPSSESLTGGQVIRQILFALGVLDLGYPKKDGWEGLQMEVNFFQGDPLMVVLG